jgi:hypothetical protein
MLTSVKAHLPGRTREQRKTAFNALKLSMELTEKVLDGFPLYGPKAAIGSLLKVIEVAQVSWIPPSETSCLNITHVRNIVRMQRPFSNWLNM